MLKDYKEKTSQINILANQALNYIYNTEEKEAGYKIFEDLIAAYPEDTLLTNPGDEVYVNIALEEK